MVGGFKGNLLSVLGGLGAQRETRNPQKQCLEEKQKQELSAGQALEGGAHMVLSLGEGAGGRGGIWGTLPRSLVRRGGV